jgi:glutamate/aspartate transport system permease protein
LADSFLGAAAKIAQRDGRVVELYLFAAAIYFAISFVASSLVKQLQSRVAIIR